MPAEQAMLGKVIIAAGFVTMATGSALSMASAPIERCKNRFSFICVKDSTLEVDDGGYSVNNSIRLRKIRWKDAYIVIDVPKICKKTQFSDIKYMGSMSNKIKILAGESKCVITFQLSYKDDEDLDELITSIFTELRFCSNKNCSSGSLSDVVLPNTLRNDIKTN